MIGTAFYVLGVIGCMIGIVAIPLMIWSGLARLWDDLRHDDLSLLGGVTLMGLCGVIVFALWLVNTGRATELTRAALQTTPLGSVASGAGHR